MQQKEVENLLTKAREAERLLRQFDSGFELGYLVEHSIVLYDGRLSVPWNEELPEAAYSGLDKLVLDLREQVVEAAKEGDEKVLLRHLGVLVGNRYWRSRVDIALVDSQIKTMREIAKGYIGLGYPGAESITECLNGFNGNGSNAYSGALELSVLVEDLCKGRCRQSNPAGYLEYEMVREMICKLNKSALGLVSSKNYFAAISKIKQITEIDISRFISDTRAYKFLKEAMTLAHFDLGVCYSQVEEDKLALKHYEIAAQIDTDPETTFRAFYKMSVIYARHNKPYEAAIAARKALQINPFYEGAKQNLEWAKSVSFLAGFV